MSVHRIVRKNKGIGFEVRYRNLKGENKSKTFNSEKEANLYDKNQSLAKSHGTLVDFSEGKKQTSTVFAEWFLPMKNKAPKTVAEINSLWKSHIEPTFGHRKINSIKTIEIRNWLLNAENENVSPDRRNRALKDVLVRVLDHAVDMGYLAKNVARGSNGKVINYGMTFKKNKRPKRVFSLIDLKELSIACGEHQLLILLMGVLGPRWAEAIALKKKDFDLSNRELSIVRSISEVNGKFFEKSTKTNQIRKLPLPEFFANRVSSILDNLSDEDYVFTNSENGFISISNFTKRVFIPALNKTNLGKATLKDLRTTAVSLMIQMGEPITVISKIAGHTDPSVTLRHYAELFPTDLASTANKIDQEFIETSHVRNLFGENKNQLVITKEKIKNIEISEEKESGPCRDRTDDPQIKSLLLYRLS
jgi:integrase